MFNLLLAILLISTIENNSHNQSKIDNLMTDIMKIKWQSINATGIVSSTDNDNYSLSGCISQSNIGIIKLNNPQSNIIPFGIISGFWSSECDVNIKNIQEEKDFFPLSNSDLVFKFYPNYPNPFKRTTKIRYDIPYMSKVKLLIYDICGRQIKQLVNEKQGIGQYNITWNGKYENGKECSSGIYFVTMKTDNYKSIKKVLLTK
jgi:hypothetical protein